MKRFSALFNLVLIASVVSACRCSVGIPEAPASPTASPSAAAQTTQPNPTPLPTPSIALQRFDPILNPSIVVGHIPPLIARSGEKLDLRFTLHCANASPNDLGSDSALEVTLYYSHGDNVAFEPISLFKEHQEEGEYWTAGLKAADSNGQALRYYLEVKDHKNNLEMRYPSGGMLALQIVEKFQSVQVPTDPTFETGELILVLPWGDGSQSVGAQQREGYPLREGPPIMDVAPDGRLALLDAVNSRILEYHPQGETFTYFPLPFLYKGQADLKFDQHGQLALLDLIGEPEGQGVNNISRLYYLADDGSVQTTAPVYATWPGALTKDLSVLDEYDGLRLWPISADGEVFTKEEQISNKTQPHLHSRFADGLFPHVAHFTDTQAGLAFEMRSEDPLGAISHFEKVPQGYIVTFSSDQIQAIWFTPEGEVIQNVVLPNEQYTEINPRDQVTIDQNGSIYFLESTTAGLEIRFLDAP